MLGTIMSPFEHVHFAELQNGRVINPLAAGHLTPYVDTTKPEVAAISLRNAETGPTLFPNVVRGRVLLIAEAYDTRQLPITGVWQPMPVAPARVDVAAESVRREDRGTWGRCRLPSLHAFQRTVLELLRARDVPEHVGVRTQLLLGTARLLPVQAHATRTSTRTACRTASTTSS